MIYESLSCLAKEMNEYLRARLKINEDKIIISGIVNQDGTVAIQGENKVVLLLLNIEREPFAKNYNLSAQQNKVSTGIMNSVSINLYIMFAAYFSNSNYAEALRFISFVIDFLQQKSVFTKQNAPTLDENIEKLMFEIESLSAERLNNIWATIGAKYMPSVVYKMRMITYTGSSITELRPVVSQLDN